MFQKMRWENIYDLWKKGTHSLPATFCTPISAETVFVQYKQNGYIYGYDWLENTAAHERKQLATKNPIEFLYFTKPTNKGTIQTAEMLMEAQDEEELAAIWIASTAKELSEYSSENNVEYYADSLHTAACEFLESRYYLWHHAMKRLVPKIILPSSVLKNIVCKDAKPVIGLIQINTLLLKNNWSILRYSSLETKESPPFRYRRNTE